MVLQVPQKRFHHPFLNFRLADDTARGPGEASLKAVLGHSRAAIAQSGEEDVGLPWSFCPQGLDGNYRCCAAGRNQTGNQCSDAENNGNHSECQPIRSSHPIEHATQIAGERK